MYGLYIIFPSSNETENMVEVVGECCMVAELYPY